MYEKLTARLDESYTVLGSAERITRIREHVFTVVPQAECTHDVGQTICDECAEMWQFDYDFADPFPFPRTAHRWTVRDLIESGKVHAGQTLTLADTDIRAVITATGGLMLPDGRVFDNPSAAAIAALDR
ncbi:hypothetical protein [Nocardia blacklockiae]|uniref:restriction system modified-DNA reader domain-containing protein n=1 Tax=Nocardia blacklockiae TaxID=480036 RepID=UPI0018933881|nr:hypothetical protein [Nocardia blacklockiae]MBF6176801.1 hypothetical protein [Nocardia blacklockiae]